MTTLHVEDRSFIDGGVAALEGFRAEILKDRGRIENEDEPVFDVILDLLDRVTQVLVQYGSEAGD